ncbi:MAG: hypothetical protein LC713_01555 [Actinobacteria bacterium]|nr:hypothetical protein [Actinomycetota bacterium]
MPLIGPRYDVPSAAGLNEFGSRIALWSQDSKVLAGWTDTRNTGRAFPAQDIFATTVVLAHGAGVSVWTIAAGGAGIAVVVVLALLGMAGMRKRSKASAG